MTHKIDMSKWNNSNYEINATPKTPKFLPETSIQHLIHPVVTHTETAGDALDLSILASAAHYTINALHAQTVGPAAPTITIVNKCSVLTDAQIEAAIPALQTQIDRDFAPIWHTSGILKFASKNESIPFDSWIVYILDDSDQAGALGYHDLTPSGMPESKIFAKTDLDYNLLWTVTLSHELLEMLADPWITNCVFVQQTNTTGTLFSFENCDACEDDQFAYEIDNVKVSDFVYPTWFQIGNHPVGTKFDHCGHISKPFQLLSGGYIGAFKVGPGSTGWTQLTHAETSKRLTAKGQYSRFNRRANKSIDIPILE